MAVLVIASRVYPTCGASMSADLGQARGPMQSTSFSPGKRVDARTKPCPRTLSREMPALEEPRAPGPEHLFGSSLLKALKSVTCAPSTAITRLMVCSLSPFFTRVGVGGKIYRYAGFPVGRGTANSLAESRLFSCCARRNAIRLCLAVDPRIIVAGPRPASYSPSVQYQCVDVWRAPARAHQEIRAVLLALVKLR